MPKHVLSIRVDDTTRAYLDEQAQATGRTVSQVAAELLAAPSFTAALTTISEALDDVPHLLSLADEPRLAAWRAPDIREIGANLTRLARRWPR